MTDPAVAFLLIAAVISLGGTAVFFATRGDEMANAFAVISGFGAAVFLGLMFVI